MNTDTATNIPFAPTCTAFSGTRRIAAGQYDLVAQSLATLGLGQGGGLLVFDDATGALVDFPWPPGYAPEQPKPPAVDAEEKPAGPAGVGRPRLGVVAREVTLLPRHWEWLALQRGGASAALRRLVEEARKTHAEHDTQRQAKERAYRFMSAIGGGLPGFEEASRALFAHDGGAFSERIQVWPEDVKAHLSWLARGAFGTH
ncbi:hypothetical protein LPB72_12695 [Hydrogenophaga crassostreae]|uniref:DUF2239 domain-containing protein n=1 Tax=Hydrogenophaga crassostreae TaxID=1763535 RepID=A0A162P5F9_9BURK|nr:DUF2239 family protein [Hydrogenophaga crassostreae]AOW14931.1 hypothetical protein LPB072_21025 [Hydrogenophaga crassostreae]OAD41498.1 hypothetical protein LPB72_12695 [Hydrogenophaga crassostreae]